MKISILLPYKENFSPDYAGAVSLNINDTLKISKYNNNTIVFGNTKYKNIFNLKYKNISLDKKLFQSEKITAQLPRGVTVGSFDIKKIK